tara:strand:+ start:336 stop:704 length:369 start_codon:yes stop_codon:yes gene_type:complete
MSIKDVTTTEDIDETELDNDTYSEIFDIGTLDKHENIFNINTYDFGDNITKPYLNKYEKTIVKIMRIEQINSGFVPLIRDFAKYNTIEDIVEEEFNLKKIPFIIKRNLINRIDYWKLEDMIL